MPPIIVDFPPNLKFTDRTDPQLIPNNRSGGVAIDGSEQVISPLSERWSYRVNVPIRNADEIRSLRVTVSKLKGRYNYLRLNLCDQYRITRKDVGAVNPGKSWVPFSDDAPFSDGVGFALARVNSPVMIAAAEGADIVYIRASDFAGTMTAGVFFSIDGWLYLVDGWDLIGSNYRIQFSPPLRRPATVSSTADFSARSIWILTDDEVGRLDLQIGRLGTVTFDLIEPILRDL